tara:strand:- start:1987 stop:2424 length:438 start_codon:yes stop_codon:yes gene_type:complete
MNTEKVVHQYLFGKTKLEFKKVELGVSDDIQKISSLAENLVKELNNTKMELKIADDQIAKAKEEAKKIVLNASNNADKVAVNADKKIKEANALMLKIGTVLDKADNAAKDLGVDSKSIKGYNEADKLYSILDSTSSEINNFTWTE